MGIEYDWSGGDGVFGSVSPGTYRFKVVSAEEKVGSKSGNKYISLTCKGVTEDVRMWLDLHFTEKSLRVTRPTMVELGLPVGTRNIEPYFFIDTVFDADCIVERQEGQRPRLRPFIDSALDGFTMGVRLVSRGGSMPESAIEDDGRPF